MSSFDRIRSRLARDTQNGWLGGVCAGLGRALNIDPRFLRAGVVIAAVFAPKIVVAAYVVAWILLPEQDVIDYSA